MGWTSKQNISKIAMQQSASPQVQVHIAGTAIFWYKVECATTHYHNLSIAVLQRNLSQQITLTRLKGTCLVGTEPSKNHTIIFLCLFQRKWNARFTIPTKIGTHIAIAVSIKLTAIWLFFISLSPSKQPLGQFSFSCILVWNQLKG